MTDAEQRSQSVEQVAAEYDRLAETYVEHVYCELDGKPFDREMLARFAGIVRGPVCDLGCGPGHIARHLHELGCDVLGVDISERMIGLASALNPGIDFLVGDLRSLPFEDGALGGALSFYSLIHLTAEELGSALGGLRRKLRPGGTLLLAVHEGNETRTPGELWGVRVELRFNFFSREQVETALAAAGFHVEEVRRRAPYAGVEAETNRLYVIASA